MGLPDLIRGVDRHRISVTSTARNYSVYDAGSVVNHKAYTAFFGIRRKNRCFDNVRCKLVLTVESAYVRPLLEKGTKTSLVAILSNGLKGRMVRYRR